MGAFLGKILQNEITTKRGASVPEVKATIYSSEIIFAERYASSGDDSPPLPDDIALFVKRETTNGRVYIGVIDQENAPVAADGEKRFYSRDSAGAPAAVLWLKDDGTIEINGDADFAVAFNDLKTAFDQLKSDYDSLVSTYNTHTHAGVFSGGASTAVPSATGSASTADIDPAKVATVKLP